jgi:predicted nucleic acid-binding protein
VAQNTARIDIPTIYLDSSVWIAFLFEESTEPERFQAARELMLEIKSESVRAVFSFYVLTELYEYVRQNNEQNPSAEFSAAARQIFALPLQIVSFLNRTDLKKHKRHSKYPTLMMRVT